MRPLTSITIYETPIHFYVIGTDAAETSFSTLKIDRSSETELIIGEPDHSYTKTDIAELLATISSSSSERQTIVTDGNTRRHANTGLVRTISKAYGLLGAIKFLEGVLFGGWLSLKHIPFEVVNSASVVTKIGHHKIYKVEDVSYIYILGSLQENALMSRSLKWNKNTFTSATPPEEKFVWNNYLLTPFIENDVRSKWTLKIIHGFVGSQMVELPCAKLAILLIARRSSVFAGTRFLKRGCNFDGAVANDVETEQIVWDVVDFNLLRWRLANLQRRGSVPLFWSQDPSTRGVVGKPPIYVDLIEPNALTTAAHFRELRRKYSHPIIVMNLVKRREKRHHENLLHEQFLKTVRYLNEFRKHGRKIDYISFDVAKCNKVGQVLPKLDQLGLKAVLKTGFFQSFPQLNVHKIRPHPLLESYQPSYSEDGSLILQHGVSRTNCVDCLDRTNVAQYGIGKVALGFQLHAMGYTSEPTIPANGELCRAIEELFDEHGDIIAWQYAGSQLVHTIKTYKKISAFQERSRDVIQTLSRYYSNTFNDYEKQNAINLPFQRGSLPNIWDINSDYYLHFKPNLNRQNEYLQWSVNVTSDTEDSEEEWLDDWLQVKANEAGIRIGNDFTLPDKNQSKRRRSFKTNEPARCLFDYVYRTFELTSFDKLLRDEERLNKKSLQLDSLNEVPGQSNKFMKFFKANDPQYTLANLNQQSVDDDEEDAEDINDETDSEDLKCEQEQSGPFGFPIQTTQVRTTSPLQRQNLLTLDSGLKSSQEVYGFDWNKKPSDVDMHRYHKYIQLSDQSFSRQNQPNDGSLRSFSKLKPIYEFSSTFFTYDSAFSTELDEIPAASMRKYIETVKNKNFEPSPLAVQLYEKYAT
ncbi:Polyphosphoinositide phosphatase [Aphelenchoides bicaudatus]|nr:Polyphosphoinositide phosphatase [Aphelenchoides bicaudatus]